MPKYLFTSDQRISQLPDRIKWVARFISDGHSISDITNKSDNNNAATLKFYFNLHKGTETCAIAANNPQYAIRNFVKKFQFPNTRTAESLNDSISEKTLIAPLRTIVKMLYLMANNNGTGTSIMSLDEILYFVFCNPMIYNNPFFDCETVVNELLQKRLQNINLKSEIANRIEWKQYDRQSREMVNVLSYASTCFRLYNGTLSFSNYLSDKDFIDEVLSYNKLWYPSNVRDFNLSNLEYINYMDTQNIPYNVIELDTPSNSKRQIQPIDTKKIASQTLPFLAALRTKPFLLLAGISGTGKSRIVRKLAQASVTEDLQTKYDPLSVANGFDRWTLHKPANFELIQVKPNWHNSLEVVGYKSNIGGAHYEFTPFVEFVAKAWKHQDVPFFLCLDEMNLAPVEQYFAEFLSAIESRSIENGEYETDPIIKPFDEFGEDVCKQMLDHLVGIVAASNVTPDSNEAKMVKRFRTKGLTLPKNLFVLGTVNMDETTFSFSRKVLDRAMSIVMDDVDYESFFSGSTADDIAEMSEDLKRLLINRETEGLKAENNDANTVKEYLTNINAVLENTPFKLGYRAANEALLYVSAVNYLSDEPNTKAALDEFTLMKILSRIEGDKRSIDDLLDKLKGVINSTDFPKSNKVLGSMSETLNKKQFVSYWTK